MGLVAAIVIIAAGQLKKQIFYKSISYKKYNPIIWNPKGFV